MMYNEKDKLLTDLKNLKKKVEIKLNVEDRLFMLEQIEKATEKRVEYMESDKRKMLNSILERESKKITINHLIIDKDNKKEIILNEKEILNETNKHFKNITDITPIRDEELENFWKDSYTPIHDIDENVYSNLLSEITEKEWIETLKNLNKGKAGGSL